MTRWNEKSIKFLVQQSGHFLDVIACCIGLKKICYMQEEGKVTDRFVGMILVKHIVLLLGFIISWFYFHLYFNILKILKIVLNISTRMII